MTDRTDAMGMAFYMRAKFGDPYCRLRPRDGRSRRPFLWAPATQRVMANIVERDANLLWDGVLWERSLCTPFMYIREREGKRPTLEVWTGRRLYSPEGLAA